MGRPFQCTKCGTLYAARAIGDQAPAISECTVCGGILATRDSAIDPMPSTKGDFWLWLSAFGEPAGWIVLVVALGSAAIARFA